MSPSSDLKMIFERLKRQDAKLDAMIRAAGLLASSDREKARVMLGIEQVLVLIPFTRSTLYRMEQAKRFPASRYISDNRRVWFEDEIVAWQNASKKFNPKKSRGHHRTPAIEEE